MSLINILFVQNAQFHTFGLFNQVFNTIWLMLKHQKGPFYFGNLTNEIIYRSFQDCYCLLWNDIFKSNCHFPLKSQGSIISLVSEGPDKKKSELEVCLWVCVWVHVCGRQREKEGAREGKREGERFNEKFGLQQCFSISPALKANYISFPALKSLLLDLTL